MGSPSKSVGMTCVAFLHLRRYWQSTELCQAHPELHNLSHKVYPLRWQPQHLHQQYHRIYKHKFPHAVVPPRIPHPVRRVGSHHRATKVFPQVSEDHPDQGGVMGHHPQDPAKFPGLSPRTRLNSPRMFREWVSQG